MPFPALPGYSVKVWARADPRFSEPDSIEIDGDRVLKRRRSGSPPWRW